jgi:hypothetical protein
MASKNHALATTAHRSDDEAGECEAGDWVDQETVDGTFKDERLGRRFKTLLSDIGGAIASLPFACQDWANTKAAYRFLSNERVDEADILSGHFQATAKRFAASDGMILVLQDTTEFSFKRERPEDIGFTKSIRTGNTKDRRKTVHSVCGILMHSSLAVTTDGLPLGVAAIKFWSRKKFKGKRALTTKIIPRAYPSRRRKAFAGCRTWSNRPRCSRRPIAAFMSATGKATSTSSFARHGNSARTSSCEPASIASPATVSTRLPTRWRRSRSRGCIASRRATSTAMSARPRWS